MYTCPRCGYTTHLIGNMKNHLGRKQICKNLLSNESIEDIRNKLFPTKIKQYACKICYKTYTHLSSKCFHEKQCIQSYHKNQNKEILCLKDKIDKLERLLQKSSKYRQTSSSECTSNIQQHFLDLQQRQTHSVSTVDLYNNDQSQK